MGSAIADVSCDDGTLINGTAFLEYGGTCPHPDEGETPTLDHVCCMEYSRWYKKSGAAVLSLQIPKQSAIKAFLASIMKPDVLLVLMSGVCALVLIQQLVWFFERMHHRSQQLQKHIPCQQEGEDDCETGNKDADAGQSGAELWWSVISINTGRELADP